MPDYRSDPSHFSEFGELAQVDAKSLVRDVLKTVSAKGKNGVIVFEDDEPRFYVDGNKLATCAVTLGYKDNRVYSKSLNELIKANPTLIEPMEFSDVIVDANPAAESDAVPLGHNAPKFEIYRVESAREYIGVLFSNESFKDSATVDPLKYVCENPTSPHENNDADHGYCGYCPYKLKDVK